MLAVSVPGAALDADDAVLIIRSQVLQLGLERAACLLADPAEVGERRIAALVVGGHRAPSRQVPNNVLVEEFGDRVDVARVERLIGATHGRYVFFCTHWCSFV